MSAATMKPTRNVVRGLYGDVKRTDRAALAAWMAEARALGYRMHTARFARADRRGWRRERQLVSPTGHVLLCIFD